MNNETPETAFMEWTVSFCSYGIDIARRDQTNLETLTGNNWLKDVDGKTVAVFYTGFGAAWGLGSFGMGGTPAQGARLPKTLRLSYHDYLEDRFYRLDAELPLQRLFELFVRAPKIVAREIRYGEVAPRYEDLRIGVAPDGHVMLWVWGVGSQVELGTYRARVLEGMTRQSYNANVPAGAFTLTEDRWLALDRMKPETVERVKAGWRPDPMWYMRHIRVKYPWRHVLSGNVSRVTELQSAHGNAEAENVGQWELGTYMQVNRLRAIPEAALFWFHDRRGQRHYLSINFSLRERAVSEPDLSEVRAAFEEVFPGRTLEDNDWLPGDQDMALVEVQVPDDFQRFTAFLVKGERRIPLPVGRVKHFELEPFTHWAGQTSERLTPEMRKLFQLGPP